ncbi:protein-disulfide reductase DsbD domain-containing protein [Aureimonas leprariae]|nr:protein-disulfide reductase DsbD domain-containing protein [Aureimonas leprariae]
MRKNVAALVTLLGILPLGLPAGAAAGDRFEGEGVRLRLLAERPDAEGHFRGALLVDLKPGWKTYWLDPGEAGIPPDLRFGNAPETVASFPAPHRVDDGFAKSIVYSAPFAVALDGRLEPGTAKPQLKATLGVCQEICIPVAAVLDAEPAASAEVRGAIDAAFAALPRPSTAEAGIVGAELSEDSGTLTVSVRPASAAAGADLFAAAPNGWAFGPPGAVRSVGDEARITLPVTAKPRKTAAAPFAIEATLAGPAGNWRASGLAVRRQR